MLTDWMDVLLLHLIRDPKTIEKLSSKVEPKDVSTTTMDNTKGFLWKCSREYYLESGKPIPQHFLVSQLVDIANAGGLRPDEIDTIGELLDFIYSVPEEQLDCSIALKYAKRMLEQVRVHTPIQDMLQEGINVSQIFDTFQAGLSAATVATAEPIDTLSAWEQMLGTTKPQWLGDTDTEYFNKVVNGGLCPGEVVVVLGPTGGFKTTMAIDLVCAMAKLQHYSMYMSYEQSYQGGDMPIRFMSRLANVNRDVLMGSEFDKLPDDDKKAIIAAKAYSPYAMFFDRSQNVDKVCDLAGMVREMITVGKVPKLMIIDQLMTWMQMWGEGGSNPDWFRKASTMIIKDLKVQICEKYNMNIVVLHQVTSASIGKRGGQSFSHTESAENKGVCNYADFGLTIGTKDESHNIFKMVASKARRGQNGSVLVQAVPGVCKFRCATDWEEDEKTGRFVQKGKKNMVPAIVPPAGAKPKGSSSVI